MYIYMYIYINIYVYIYIYTHTHTYRIRRWLGGSGREAALSDHTLYPPSSRHVCVGVRGDVSHTSSVQRPEKRDFAHVVSPKA